MKRGRLVGARVRGMVRGALGVVAVIVAIGKAAAPQPSAVAAPSEDPRVAMIRSRLERQGLKVTEVGFAPATATAPAVWLAGTDAAYAAPSWPKVTDQALTVWATIFPLIKGENASTLVTSSQNWKTFRLFLGVKLANLTAFDAGTQTAKTDADRQKATQALYAGAVFRVIDLQAQKFVHTDQFIKEHFAK